MKITTLSRFFLLFIAASFFLVSCEDESGGGTGGNEDLPSIAFEGTSGTAITLLPEESFTVNISATEGDSPLRTLTVVEDGADVSLTRISYDGVAADANPTLLFGDDKTSFTREVTVVSQSGVSTNVYRFEVMDEDGETSSISVDVSTTASPPTLNYMGPASFETTPGQKNSISISASKGSGRFSTMEVRENGTAIADLTRLELDGEAFTANPFELPETAKDEIDGMLVLTAPTMVGTYEYLLILTDEFGMTSEASFTITVNPSGTPVSLFEGVLFNAAGPAGTGGLDLDLGQGVGSSDAAAEIRDEGIDTSLPGSSNWLQQISGVNGTEVVYLNANENGLPEDFTFGSIEFSEQIETFFGNGVAFTATNAAGKSISDAISVGDVFAAKNGENYYAFEIVEVNATTGDNGDNYKMNIKL